MGAPRQKRRGRVLDGVSGKVHSKSSQTNCRNLRIHRCICNRGGIWRGEGFLWPCCIHHRCVGRRVRSGTVEECSTLSRSSPTRSWLPSVELVVVAKSHSLPGSRHSRISR